jgi:glutaconate CoA-transferase subunit A
MPDRPAATCKTLAAEIGDGAMVAVMKDICGAPMALARALILKGVRGLHLVCVPTGGLLHDVLIGAGCVATVEGSGVTLGEYGQAPCFVRAVKSGAVRPLDSTCPAVYTALQAGEKGIPFIPMRGLVGSDLLRYRDDYKLIDNPFDPGDRIVAIPALRPDFALMHAPLADARGDLWVGRQHELKILAHAANRTLATVEARHPATLVADPLYAAGTLSSLYVHGIAVAKRGAWPLAMPGAYAEDAAAIAAYVEAAATPQGFAAWLDRFLAGEDGGLRQAAAE